ncbi:hypothetical protein BRADI_1g65135v3, partial [Brachypodium distachyon]
VHLFLRCPGSVLLWHSLGLTINGPVFFRLWTLPTPAALPQIAWPSVLLAILWRLWKTRNSMLFDNEHVPIERSIRLIAGDISLWTFRLKNVDLKVAVGLWHDYLLSLL